MELILGFLLGLIVGLLMCYISLEQSVKFFHKVQGEKLKSVQAVDRKLDNLDEEIIRPMGVTITDEDIKAQREQSEIIKEWLIGKEDEI